MLETLNLLLSSRLDLYVDRDVEELKKGKSSERNFQLMKRWGQGEETDLLVACNSFVSPLLCNLSTSLRLRKVNPSKVQLSSEAHLLRRGLLDRTRSIEIRTMDLVDPTVLQLR